MRHRIERRRSLRARGQRPHEIVAQRGVREGAEGGERIAAGGGICGIGFDQQVGAGAAHDVASEIDRDLHHEQHLAFLQQAARLFGAFVSRDDIEIARIFAPRRRWSARSGPGSSMAIAAGNSFGFKLMAKPNRNSCISGTPMIMPRVRRSRRICRNSFTSIANVRREREETHLAAFCCSWMNTSSRLGWTSSIVMPGSPRILASARFEGSAIVAADVQRRAEKADILDAGLALQRVGEMTHVLAFAAQK